MALKVIVQIVDTYLHSVLLCTGPLRPAAAPHRWPPRKFAVRALEPHNQLQIVVQAVEFGVHLRSDALHLIRLAQDASAEFGLGQAHHSGNHLDIEVVPQIALYGLCPTTLENAAFLHTERRGKDAAGITLLKHLPQPRTRQTQVVGVGDGALFCKILCLSAALTLEHLQTGFTRFAKKRHTAWQHSRHHGSRC